MIEHLLLAAGFGVLAVLWVIAMGLDTDEGDDE